jgi:hypothetical protein
MTIKIQLKVGDLCRHKPFNGLYKYKIIHINGNWGWLKEVDKPDTNGFIGWLDNYSKIPKTQKFWSIHFIYRNGTVICNHIIDKKENNSNLESILKVFVEQGRKILGVQEVELEIPDND